MNKFWAVGGESWFTAGGTVEEPLQILQVQGHEQLQQHITSDLTDNFLHFKQHICQ